VDFDFTSYMVIKFIVLVALAFFGNFFYTLITGRSLEQERRRAERDTATEEQRD
jgi:hypothetical protein